MSNINKIVIETDEELEKRIEAEEAELDELQNEEEERVIQDSYCSTCTCGHVREIDQLIYQHDFLAFLLSPFNYDQPVKIEKGMLIVKNREEQMRTKIKRQRAERKYEELTSKKQTLLEKTNCYGGKNDN